MVAHTIYLFLCHRITMSKEYILYSRAQLGVVQKGNNGVSRKGKNKPHAILLLVYYYYYHGAPFIANFFSRLNTRIPQRRED